MNTRVVVAVAVAVCGVAAITVESVRAWLALRRVESGDAVTGPQEAVHGADWIALGGLWAVILACGLAAGWVWAVLLGGVGAAAVVRYGRATRVEIRPDCLVFGTGRSRAELDPSDLGAIVVAARSGGFRSYGTISFADTDGAWVAVIRAAALADPAGCVSRIVALRGLQSHDGELGWRHPAAAPPTGSLPRLQR